MTPKMENLELKKRQVALERRITFFTRGAVALVVVGLVLGILGFMSLPKMETFSIYNLSLLGSYLQGTVASFWSLAALLFIYVAFLGQKQQLLQQDAELDDQHRQFEAQSFESAFFELLNIQNQIVTSFQKTDGFGREHTGRACFKELFQEFKQAFEKSLGAGMPTTPGALPRRTDMAVVARQYEHFYNEYQGELGHYFRNLYHVMKFVKTDEIPGKKRYTSLARAQLSTYELVLLFYNCISAEGINTKPLVEQFGLLANLDKRLLLDPSHENFYATSAFE